jgi:hypothetical protein
LVWSGLVWSGLVCFPLFARLGCSALVWSGLVWPGLPGTLFWKMVAPIVMDFMVIEFRSSFLDWSGLVWSGLVCPLLSAPYLFYKKSQDHRLLQRKTFYYKRKLFITKENRYYIGNRKQTTYYKGKQPITKETEETQRPKQAWKPLHLNRHQPDPPIDRPAD